MTVKYGKTVLKSDSEEQKVICEHEPIIAERVSCTASLLPSSQALTVDFQALFSNREICCATDPNAEAFKAMLFGFCQVLYY
jgi:hypothetical protein